MNAAGKPRVAIIDYGMGNLFSVEQACVHAGLAPVITYDAAVIMSADAAILPGVGAFGDAMDCLKERSLPRAINEFIGCGKPFMGVCLGMQLLMSWSEEFGKREGLNAIKGSVVRFTGDDSLNKMKIPQMGWNRISSPRPDGDEIWKRSPLRNINDGAYMYFVHSFYAVPEDPEVVLSVTNYEGNKYCSSILSRNIFACQFHPERSASEGLKIYYDWARSIKQ